MKNMSMCAECTKDTEQTEATAGQLCSQDGEECYEVEIVHEGENEESALRDRCNSCPKSARHSEYIPVPDFCMDHLPPQYRTERMLALVKAQIKLTVLVKVGSTSDGRTKYFPDTDKDALRRGSGRVVAVWVYTNEGWGGDEKCRCVECQTSGKPRQSYGVIKVVTAAHVVFDQAEGTNTECYFDFDIASTDLCSCPTLRNAVHVWVDDPRRDISWVTFVTHDLEWARQLEETVKTYWRLWREISREHGVEFVYGSGEENLLDNISLLCRSYQKVTEKSSEWIDRLRNMTTAEAERKLEEHKRKYNIQPGDWWLFGSGETLHRDGDLYRQELSDVSGRYEECALCMAVVRDLEENYQSYVQQHGVQWVKDKYRKYCDELKYTTWELADEIGDEVGDLSDLFCYRSSHPLTIVVSHPHGLREQISIGQVIDRSHGTSRYVRASYIYTATTCRGSSGAPVYILGRVRDWGYEGTCPHSGCCGTADTNKSGVVDDLW